MQWSQLKKRVEAQFAEVLQGRVQVWMTKYRSDPLEPVGRAWITFDSVEIASLTDMPSSAVLAASAKGEDVRGKGTLLMDPFLSSGDFHRALVDYLQTGIAELLEREDELLLGLAMLDRRLGQRRFAKLAPALLTSPFVARLHDIRRTAEGWR